MTSITWAIQTNPGIAWHLALEVVGQPQGVNKISSSIDISQQDTLWISNSEQSFDHPTACRPFVQVEVWDNWEEATASWNLNPLKLSKVLSTNYNWRTINLNTLWQMRLFDSSSQKMQQRSCLFMKYLAESIIYLDMLSPSPYGHDAASTALVRSSEDK